MTDDKKLFVGIDLGTTFTCVAVFQNNKVDIIENRLGHKITPSVVTFNDNENIVGKVSKVSENTIYEMKRLIGRKYDEEILKQDYKNWTFHVDNVDSLPMIKLKIKENYIQYHPEQISAMILSYMKEVATVRLGQNIENVVITVPAYFNDSQRKATIDAAKIAGLKCLQIINEPTAAAIAYYYDKKIPNNKKILVFDLGGGTFDVSIVSIENDPKDTFKVIAIGGDTHLGGVDFTNRMVEYFLDNYKHKFKIELRNDKKAMHRLRLACEEAKIELSQCLETTIEIDAFQNEKNFIERMSRALFEDINKDLFKKTIEILENTINDANLRKESIDEIILIGGSTRIPKIKDLLKEFFNGEEKLRQTINPDEAVAYGAALKAAMLSESQNKDLPDIQFIDATPLSLGVSVREKEMSVIVKRNTNIPCTITKEYTTLYDNQKSILFKIYEGERLLVEENILLGEFTLDNIEKAPAGIPNVIVRFSIDKNGILHASAIDKKTLTKNDIVITKTRGLLSEEKIKKLIINAKINENFDRKKVEILRAKNELEVFIYNKKSSGIVIEQFQQVLDWLSSTQIFTVYELENKLSILKNECLNYNRLIK